MKAACRAFETKINNTCGGKHRAITLTYRAVAMEFAVGPEDCMRNGVKTGQGGEIENSLDFGNL